MKRLIYILFLLIGFEQALFARKIDTLRTERLELRLEPDLVGFIPCGKEWFQVQKDAWKLEIDKDVRNEKAWDEEGELQCKIYVSKKRGLDRDQRMEVLKLYETMEDRKVREAVRVICG